MASSSNTMEEKVVCPCTLCKYQILRKRRICNEHVRKHGEFNREHVQNLHYDSYGLGMDSCDITPVSERRRKRSMLTEYDDAGRSMEGVEGSGTQDGMEEMLDAFFETNEEQPDETHPSGADQSHEDMMRKLARQPIFEGAKTSVLRACLSFLNLQSVYGWSDTSVTALFRLLRDQILPDENDMPPTRADAKRLLTSIGLDYNRIHACPNDCILFRNEFADCLACPKCGANRYKQEALGDSVPAKVLRHFSIIPRIKSMF